MSKREHRRFTAEQKLQILREAEQPGVTVSQVCRRNGLALRATNARAPDLPPARFDRRDVLRREPFV